MKTRIMAALCLGAATMFAQQAEERMTEERFEVPGAGTLLYRQHVTPNLPKDKKVPLVLYLHGAGSRGNDNKAHVKIGVPSLIPFADANGGAVVIAPQCPEDKRWVEVDWGAASHAMPAEPSAPMKLLLALLDDKLAKMPVDADRVYVTGVSMGGFGAWDILQRRPNLFAAALPLCGGGDPAFAPAIKNVPVWIFHGGGDGVVKVARSRDMEAALKACGGNVRYREYPNVGHDCWTQTYADKDVLKWMFEQCRAKGNDSRLKDLRPQRAAPRTSKP